MDSVTPPPRPEPEPDDKDWTWVLDAPCPQCGYDASTVEAREIAARVRASVSGWTSALALPTVRVRPEPRVWSVLEYGCHVRDVHAIFGRRLTAMLEQGDPLFDNWDQDATALAERYQEQVPVAVSAALADEAGRTAGLFDAVTDGEWDRTGRRSNGSVFTVRTLGLYYLHDLEHHAHDIAS